MSNIRGRDTGSTGRGNARTTGAVVVREGLDPWLFGAVAVLVGLGLVLVYSSSAVFALRTYGDAERFITRQGIATVLGLGIAFVLMRVPGPVLSRHAGLLMMIAVALCLLVLIPGIGVYRGGARRWIGIGSFGLQPSELTKVILAIALAAVLARRDERPRDKPSLLVPVLLTQIPVMLVLAEPDLGTALVLELVLCVMVFVAGLRLRLLLLLSLAALPVLYHLVVSTPFRLRRILSYIDPWAYRSTVGFQVTEAMISMGSGGVTGVGLGDGKHRLFFLPEAHTDFILAILAEELGLIGVSVLLVAFGVVAWRGLRLALLARDPFDRYLAVGLTALIVVPALFNVGVVTGLLPTKGLCLPFVSYGGSSMLASLAVVGLLLRIANQSRDGGQEGRA